MLDLLGESEGFEESTYTWLVLSTRPFSLSSLSPGAQRRERPSLPRRVSAGHHRSGCLSFSRTWSTFGSSEDTSQSELCNGISDISTYGSLILIQYIQYLFLLTQDQVQV